LRRQRREREGEGGDTFLFLHRPAAVIDKVIESVFEDNLFDIDVPVRMSIRRDAGSRAHG